MFTDRISIFRRNHDYDDDYYHYFRLYSMINNNNDKDNLSLSLIDSANTDRAESERFLLPWVYGHVHVLFILTRYLDPYNVFYYRAQPSFLLIRKY